jgi:hypothetical protein
VRNSEFNEVFRRAPTVTECTMAMVVTELHKFLLVKRQR